MLPVWAIGIIVAILGVVGFLGAASVEEGMIAKGRNSRQMRFATPRDRRNDNLALLFELFMILIMAAGIVLVIVDLSQRFVWPLIVSVKDSIPWSASGSGEEAAWLFAAFGLGALAFGLGAVVVTQRRK